MLRFLIMFILVFGVWLILTFSLLWQEVVIGLILALIITFFTRDFIFKKPITHLLNPTRWFNFLKYLLFFLWLEIQAHMDLSYRIISGKINPVIIKLPTTFKTDIGKTMLSNSINLTPGTLTIKVGKEFYVHCITHKASEKIDQIFKRLGKVIK